MKPIHELTAADLERNPVWEWAYDEEDGDETYVTPTQLRDSIDDGEYHVACDVVTAHGKQLTGFVVVDAGELVLGEGLFAVGNVSGQYFALDTPPHGRKERAAFEALFGTSYDDVFPVQWRARVAIASRDAPLEGVIDRPWRT